MKHLAPENFAYDRLYRFFDLYNRFYRLVAQTQLHSCRLHELTLRHSLNYVSWKRRHEVPADLHRIYTAATSEEVKLMWASSGQMGYRVPANRPVLAQELEPAEAVLQFPGGDQESDLHQQCH